MRINEFNKNVSAKTLNESVAQQFGQKLDLNSFTIEQLHDARNKLRTKISQVESSSGYDAVYENESYQKSKLFLDVLNREISERESAVDPSFNEMEQMVLDKVNEGLIEFDDLPFDLQSRVIEAAGTDEQLSEVAPQGWEGTVKGMKKHKDEIDNPWALAWYMKNKGYKSHKKESVEESIVREGEEERAELIISAKNLVDKVTAWMEDTAQMQAEAMLDIVDHIRDELGLEQSQEFESITKPALASIYTALESAREQLNQGVGVLTGEGEMAPSLGEPVPGELPTEPVPGEEEFSDLEGDLESGIPGEDEFATAAPAAGGAEEAGRAKRESIEFGRRLGLLLTSKKK